MPDTSSKNVAKYNTEKRRSVAGTVLGDMVVFEPKPLEEPHVNENFEAMNGIERTVECVRFSLASLLYILSPRGILAAWMIMCTRMTVYLGATAVVLSVAVVAAKLAMMTAIYVCIALLAVMMCVAMCKALAQHMREQSGENK